MRLPIRTACSWIFQCAGHSLNLHRVHAAGQLERTEPFESFGTRHMRHSKPIIRCLLTVVFLFGNHGVGRTQTLTPIHIGVSTNSATRFPLYVAYKRGCFRARPGAIARLYAGPHVAGRSGVKANRLHYANRFFAYGDRTRPAGTACDGIHRQVAICWWSSRVNYPGSLRGRVVAMTNPAARSTASC